MSSMRLFNELKTAHFSIVSNEEYFLIVFLTFSDNLSLSVDVDYCVKSSIEPSLFDGLDAIPTSWYPIC